MEKVERRKKNEKETSKKKVHDSKQPNPNPYGYD